MSVLLQLSAAYLGVARTDRNTLAALSLSLDDQEHPLVL